MFQELDAQKWSGYQNSEDKKLTRHTVLDYNKGILGLWENYKNKISIPLYLPFPNNNFQIAISRYNFTTH
jgi:hypothetical protein